MLNREATYKLLKKHEKGIILGKDVLSNLNLAYRHQLNDPTYIKDIYFTIQENDEFVISDEGKDFLTKYEFEYRPIAAAERANVIAILALIISVTALSLSIWRLFR